MRIRHVQRTPQWSNHTKPVREGSFYGKLVGGFLYRSRDFNDKEKINLQMGLTFHVEDNDSEHDPIEGTENLYEYTEHFLNLNVDDDGNFTPGGERARAYKLLSGFYGKDFNSFDEDFEWGFYGPWMDNISGIDDVPLVETFEKGAPWPTPLTDIDILGDSLIGRRAILKFGYPTNPQTKQPGKRLKALDAVPIPGGGAAPEPVKNLDAPAEPPVKPKYEGEKHVVWVRELLDGLGLGPVHHKGFLVWWDGGENFTEDMNVKEFPKDSATTLARLVKNDKATVVSLVDEYKNEQNRASPIDEEFPPEDDLPF